MQTKSKHFKDHEIKGILPDGSIYLKMGVTRKKYNDQVIYDDMDHINEKLIIAEKINKFYLMTGLNPLDNTED